MKNNVKKVCIFGIALALWVVTSSFLHIPIGIGHLWIDVGYVVYGLMLTVFGIPATIIGVLGVFLENVLFTGWISYSWMTGQVVIGIACGYFFKKFYTKPWIAIVVAIASTWVGIGLVKTVIEIMLGYGVFPVKIVTNSIAAVLDVIPLICGFYFAKIKAINELLK